MSVYDPYKYLLTNEVENKANRFVTKSRSLREYVNEIEKLKRTLGEVQSLPILVPMNFFVIDCHKINEVSISIYCILLSFNLSSKLDFV